MPKISVAEAKSHLSELIARSAHAHERFIITRRDKPVAALVSLDDLKIIEQHEERQGLAAPDNILMPAIILYEVYKVLKREVGEEKALLAVGYRKNSQVVPFDATLALAAADLALREK